MLVLIPMSRSNLFLFFKPSIPPISIVYLGKKCTMIQYVTRLIIRGMKEKEFGGRVYNKEQKLPSVKPIPQNANGS